MPPKFWLPVGYVLPFMMPAPSGPENVQGSFTRPLISMGISPARAEAAAKAMATIEHARRKLAFIRQILRCANRTVLTCWTAVDYTPPAIGKPALACGKSYGAPPRLPATRGVYEIAAPEGSLNPSPTTTVVLGASEDRSGSATTYRLPIGAKHAVAPDLFASLTPARRSSKIKTRQKDSWVSSGSGSLPSE